MIPRLMRCQFPTLQAAKEALRRQAGVRADTSAALAKVEIKVDIPEGASAQTKLEIKK